MLLQTWSLPLPPLPAGRRHGSRKASQGPRSHRHRRRVIISNKVGILFCSIKLPTAEFADILQNKVLLAATISGAIGQFSKPFTSSLFRRSGVLDFRKAIQAGGFPSSHSSATVAVATTLGFERGFSDPIFGLAFVYACLTMYDAQGVRREVGNHARCLNKVLSEEKLKQIVSINDDNDSTDSIPKISSNLGSFESAQEIGSVLVESADSRTSANRESELSSVNFIPLKESVGHTETEVIAVLKDPRMAASLLRLHFHDCFVMGCDGSVLLDNYGSIITSEKQAGPNLNSLRGFEVIDEIKYIIEEACPGIVSCADILALAARDSVVLRGGPTWGVDLGRRDSLTSSFNGANQFIPAPNSTLQTLISNFQRQGLDAGDLVALSGSHTLGKARCVSFRQRIYDVNAPQTIGYYDKDKIYVRSLRSTCPKSGKDNALVPLDLVTPARFDNHYFNNIIQGRGLLISDNVLVDQDLHWEIRKHVFAYASNQDYFFDSFVKSMIKMGNINVLTGNQGEIRRNCRYINS